MEKVNAGAKHSLVLSRGNKPAAVHYSPSNELLHLNFVEFDKLFDLRIVPGASPGLFHNILPLG